MNALRRFYAFLMFRNAVQKAEKLHAQNHVRYYVCPNSDKKVRLIVTDRKNFRGLRSKRYIDSNYKMKEAYEMCFYCTGDAGGNGMLSESTRKAKAIRFFEWYEDRIPAVRKMRKDDRKKRRTQRLDYIKHIFKSYGREK